ncbi:MAG: class I SAM-dependent methyltransferase [Chloroflexi bacterium]|nr:MAG: class I SAM-dependent methyltransferase [Chloroflexota bacterium]
MGQPQPTNRTPQPDRGRIPASFRDPSGFVYERDGRLLRQINDSFAERWSAFEQSALRRELTGDRLLIEHQPAPLELAWDEHAAAVIEPERVELITYPWEWSFSQLRDAALLTLEAQERAAAAGFTLRDASAFNVQFLRGKPILIDSLSFEPATPEEPWLPYREFCEQFVAPLALMAYRDARLGLLMRPMPSGIPLDLASALLPARTRLSTGISAHIHLHARAQQRPISLESATRARAPRVSSLGRRALVDHLRRTVEGMRKPRTSTPWASYETTSTYSPAAADAKLRLVGELLQQTPGRWVWDVGANRGWFSLRAAELGRQVVALDSDAGAVDMFYRQLQSAGDERVLPLVMDIANPTPGVGWALEDYRSLIDRCNADVILALALIHHLAIGRNIPLDRISALFARLGEWLIIEWVPKTDPMVAAMLAHREDVFGGYDEAAFKQAFESDFSFERSEPIPDSDRVLHLLRRRRSLTH